MPPALFEPSETSPARDRLVGLARRLAGRVRRERVTLTGAAAVLTVALVAIGFYA